MLKKSKSLTAQSLARYFDHTFLKANATINDMKKLCDESIHYGFRMVAINPVWVPFCKEVLKGSDVHVGAAIGFALGQNTIETKVFETKNSLELGADEIDYVINISKLKEKDYAYIEQEMIEIIDLCRKYHATSKVIFENCYLTDQEKKELCRIACKVKPDYIKTSTGFGTGGALIEDLKLMKECVDGSGIKLKAAGGIRSLETALELIDLGVERIGSTSSVTIVNEFQNATASNL